MIFYLFYSIARLFDSCFICCSMSPYKHSSRLSPYTRRYTSPLSLSHTAIFELRCLRHPTKYVEYVGFARSVQNTQIRCTASVETQVASRRWPGRAAYVLQEICVQARGHKRLGESGRLRSCNDFISQEIRANEYMTKEWAPGQTAVKLEPSFSTGIHHATSAEHYGLKVMG